MAVSDSGLDGLYMCIAGISCAYQVASIYANDEVEPRFQLQLLIGVAQDLKAAQVLVALCMLWLAVQSRDQSVEGAEHGDGGSACGSSLLLL